MDEVTPVDDDNGEEEELNTMVAVVELVTTEDERGFEELRAVVPAVEVDSGVEELATVVPMVELSAVEEEREDVRIELVESPAVEVSIDVCKVLEAVDTLILGVGSFPAHLL